MSDDDDIGWNPWERTHGLSGSYMLALPTVVIILIMKSKLRKVFKLSNIISWIGLFN